MALPWIGASLDAIRGADGPVAVVAGANVPAVTGGVAFQLEDLVLRHDILISRQVDTCQGRYSSILLVL